MQAFRALRSCLAVTSQRHLFNVSNVRKSRRQLHTTQFSRSSTAFIDELKERGLITAISSESIHKLASDPEKCAVYAGFDPTGPSLHIGHLLIICTLAHFKRAGFKPIALVGGATGLIGDPSGRSDERPLLDEKTVEFNLQSIKRSLSTMLGENVQVVNNYDWYRDMSAVEFLRGIGRHFRLGTMLMKDSVKSRLDSEAGLSFTEFSYQMLQAYDFHYLFKHKDCKIQIGGNDQWGNITAGIELIRKLNQQEGVGVTVQLLTTASGAKISKSQGNAVWLSPDYDSPYTLYQFFMRLTDADVPQMLRQLTFLPLDQIKQIEIEHMKAPEKREGHKILATEVVRFVHGEKGVQIARSASEVLFGGNIDGSLKSSDFEAIFKGSGCIVEMPRSSVVGQTLLSVAGSAKLVASKGELKRIFEQNGFYLNNKPEQNQQRLIEEADVIDNSILLLRTGKKNYKLVKLV